MRATNATRTSSAAREDQGNRFLQVSVGPERNFIPFFFFALSWKKAGSVNAPRLFDPFTVVEQMPLGIIGCKLQFPTR